MKHICCVKHECGVHPGGDVPARWWHTRPDEGSESDAPLPEYIKMIPNGGQPCTHSEQSTLPKSGARHSSWVLPLHIAGEYRRCRNTAAVKQKSEQKPSGNLELDVALKNWRHKMKNRSLRMHPRWGRPR